jgi:hypothetical protein
MEEFQRLNERYELLVASSIRGSSWAAKAYLREIQRDHRLTHAHAELEGAASAIDESPMGPSLSSRNTEDLIDSDFGFAVRGYEQLRKIARREVSDIQQHTTVHMAGAYEPDRPSQHALREYVEPLHWYLRAQIAGEGVFVAHLERLAQWARYFGHMKLDVAAREEEKRSSGRSQCEKRLCDMAAEWMMLDGLDISDLQREPDSSSGKIDYLIRMPGPVDWVVEAKIVGRFGSTTYELKTLRGALSQLMVYRADTGRAGSLLAFHRLKGEVLLEGADARRVSGNTWCLGGVYVTLVRLKAPPRPSDQDQPDVLELPPRVRASVRRALSGTERERAPELISKIKGGKLDQHLMDLKSLEKWRPRPRRTVLKAIGNRQRQLSPPTS